jgi:16S rRNA processing protein RimM
MVTTPPSEASAGRIVGVFGLRGECKIDATRIGADSIRPGLVVRARLPDGNERELRVRTMRLHKGRPLATFDGFDDATAAEALTGATLVLARADVKLHAGEHLDVDLVGCMLVDGAGRDAGRVVAVEHYPAQDMLVVGDQRALVPMVAAFVKRIDTAAKRIDVEIPPGLLDSAEAETS